MVEDPRSTVRVVPTGERSLTVELTPDPSALALRVPAVLRGRPLPGFVAEWLIEAEEMAIVIDDLLQIEPSTAQPDRVRALLRSLPNAELDVTGFSMPQIVPGLPVGLDLPFRLLEIVALAERCAAWLDKGRRVREWLEDAGHGQLSWLAPADEVRHVDRQ